MATTEATDVMIIPGMFEERVVSGIKEHPSKVDPDATYATGYVSLSGKRTPVHTGFWGDVEIWQLDRDSERWPACHCGTPLDIGSSLSWHCWTCKPASVMRQKAV